jgi:O-methyltransferase involved in polyketide biosynthesis
VPVDFASHGLDDGLAAADVDVRKPVYVAWLGVTQYIPKPATERTLTLVGRLAPGSEIVFDVILPLDAQPPADREMSAIWAPVSRTIFVRSTAGR